MRLKKIKKMKQRENKREKKDVLLFEKRKKNESFFCV